QPGRPARDRRQLPRRDGRQRRRPARPGRGARPRQYPAGNARSLERQHRRGTRQHDRVPAGLRDQLQDDLVGRRDAAQRQPDPVRPVMTRQTAAAAALILLAACGPARPAGFTATLPPPPQAAPAPAGGAISTAATAYAPLHYGQRAHRIGDLVTVVLVERTTTSKSADSSQQRDGGFALRPPAAGPFAFDPNVLNSGGSSSFNGGG